jgi:hypothetical protein
MAGLTWDAPELLLLIIYERAGSHHSYIIKKLRDLGSQRSLDSVRSKIYDLKGQKAVFDRKTTEWNEVEMQWLIRELDQDAKNGKLFEEKYKSEE